MEPLSSPLPSPTCHHPPHDTAACPGPSRETLRHESHRRQGHRGGGRRGRQARQTLGGSRAVTWLARYKRRGRVDRPPPGSDPCRRRERRVDPSFTELAPTALGARVNAGAPEPVQVEPQALPRGTVGVAAGERERPAEELHRGQRSQKMPGMARGIENSLPGEAGRSTTGTA